VPKRIAQHRKWRLARKTLKKKKTEGEQAIVSKGAKNCIKTQTANTVTNPTGNDQVPTKMKKGKKKRLRLDQGKMEKSWEEDKGKGNKEIETFRGAHLWGKDGLSQSNDA